MRTLFIWLVFHSYAFRFHKLSDGHVPIAHHLGCLRHIQCGLSNAPSDNICLWKLKHGGWHQLLGSLELKCRFTFINLSVGTFLVCAVTVDKIEHYEYQFLSNSRPFQQKLICVLRGKKTISMTVKQTWMVIVHQQAFEEFVCQSQRWFDCFAIIAYFAIATIALKVITAETGECGLEAECMVFAILLTMFTPTPAPIWAHSLAYPRSLPSLSTLTPAHFHSLANTLTCADAWILTGEWSKPNALHVCYMASWFASIYCLSYSG